MHGDSRQLICAEQIRLRMRRCKRDKKHIRICKRGAYEQIFARQYLIYDITRVFIFAVISYHNPVARLRRGFLMAENSACAAGDYLLAAEHIIESAEPADYYSAYFVLHIIIYPPCFLLPA